MYHRYHIHLHPTRHVIALVVIFLHDALQALGAHRDELLVGVLQFLRNAYSSLQVLPEVALRSIKSDPYQILYIYIYIKVI